jgi:soluble lytic murein transglycosylase-like protein
MADKFGTKEMFTNALKTEGVTGKLADAAWAIYGVESGGGGTKTSVSGARGGMQVMPATFKSVADKDWNIDNPEHNARAGIRYLKQMHDIADGDIGLTAAGYNGGPGAIVAAKQGKGLYVKGHPEYGSTLDYAAKVKKQVEGKSAEPIVEAKVVPLASTPVAVPVKQESILPVVKPVTSQDLQYGKKEAPVPVPVQQAKVPIEKPAVSPKEVEDIWKEFDAAKQELAQSNIQIPGEKAQPSMLDALAALGPEEAAAEEQGPQLQVQQLQGAAEAKALQQHAAALRQQEIASNPYLPGTQDSLQNIAQAQAASNYE